MQALSATGQRPAKKLCSGSSEPETGQTGFIQQAAWLPSNRRGHDAHRSGELSTRRPFSPKSGSPKRNAEIGARSVVPSTPMTEHSFTGGDREQGLVHRDHVPACRRLGCARRRRVRSSSASMAAPSRASVSEITRLGGRHRAPRPATCVSMYSWRKPRMQRPSAGTPASASPMNHRGQFSGTSARSQLPPNTPPLAERRLRPA